MSGDNSHLLFSGNQSLKRHDDQEVDDLLNIMMRKNKKLRSLIDTSFASRPKIPQQKDQDSFEFIFEDSNY